MAETVFYICPGRSFRSDRPRRKMEDIIKCWRQMRYDVEHIAGGDLYHSSNTLEDHIKARKAYYKKWYRRVSFMAPFVNSCSERRDIRHNQLMLEKLSDIVEKKRPDLIWERSNQLASAGLTIAKRIGVPYVLEWTDNIASYSVSLHRRRALKLEKRKNQQANYIIVVSSKIKQNLIAEGIEADKILVTFNAVNPEEFHVDRPEGQRYRAELRIADNEILIGYLGSYSWYHDMTRLVLAADILKRRNKVNIKILMVGTGKQYNQIRGLAQKLNLLDSVIIMKPWVPKEAVPTVLSALDIAVLPGCTDIICPIKVQEYMAMELPSVVPDYLPNREVITNGQTGVLFEPKNEISLAERLLILAKDHKLRQAIGKQARREVLQRFTWEKTWGKTLQEIIARVSGNFTTSNE